MDPSKEAWIRESAAKSTSWKDFAARLGYSYLTARIWAKRLNITDLIPDGRVGNQTGSEYQGERNKQIWHRRYVIKDTLQNIADDYKISRQRVYAIARDEQKRLADDV